MSEGQPTLQGDWEWIRNVLKMTSDRVVDGEYVTLYRPKGFSKTADIRQLMEDGVMRMVRTILSTAEVVDQD